MVCYSSRGNLKCIYVTAHTVYISEHLEKARWERRMGRRGRKKEQQDRKNESGVKKQRVISELIESESFLVKTFTNYFF